jgi:mono/diheme cytochrome c family protein
MCTGCHGPGLSGGPIAGGPPDWPPAANLTPTGLGHYTEADFIRALREGVRPGGVPIDAAMPVARITRHMTDVELRALYAYLRSVPPRPYGSR